MSKTFLFYIIADDVCSKANRLCLITTGVIIHVKISSTSQFQLLIDEDLLLSLNHFIFL